MRVGESTGPAEFPQGGGGGLWGGGGVIKIRLGTKTVNHSTSHGVR